ncbi:hypothetical protein CTT30_23325 (plasmid) [Vibrio coralliilyticus]|nr:hypothetical protein CTT30_23325 [Vibrio coralliilyticus]
MKPTIYDTLYHWKNSYYRLRSTPLRNTLTNVRASIIELSFRTIFREKVVQYMRFTALLSGSDEGGIVGSPFLSVTDKQYNKLIETYPERWKKIPEKYLSKTVKDRSNSAKPEVKHSLEPFLNSTDKMIMSASKDPIAALNVIIKQGDAKANLMKSVRAALRAPVMYLLIIIAFAAFSQAEYISALESVLIRMDKEPPARVVMFSNVNEFILGNLFSGFISLIVIYSAYSWCADNMGGKARTTIERAPLFGVPLKYSRLIQSGLFLQSISLLYTSGINTSQAFKVMSSNSNSFIKSKVSEMTKSYRLNGSDIEAFRNDLFDRETQYRLSVFFELSDPSTNMNIVAKSILEDIEQKIMSFANRVNFMGKVTFACYILLFVLANFSMSQA